MVRTLFYASVASLGLGLSSAFSLENSALGQDRPITNATRRRLLMTSLVPLVALQQAQALTPIDASKQYDAYASNYDKLDGGDASSTLGIDQARSQLLQKAKGHVLEIGVGTGLNLDKYIGSQIASLTLVDISEGMLRQAQAKVQGLTNLKDVPNIQFIKADATSSLVTSFGEDRYDTVVDSFSLCVMGDQGARQCLDQIARVVQPQGRVLLLENTRSSNPWLGKYQDVTAEAAAALGGKGCVYNQDVSKMIRDADRLAIVDEREYSAGLFRSYECTKIIV